MARLFDHIRSDKIKWGIAGAVLLLLIATVVVLSLYVAGVFDGKGETYRFEAEEAELAGGAQVTEAEGTECVGEFIDNGGEDHTITYRVYATEDCTAGLTVCIAADEVDRNITDFMDIEVNGVALDPGYRVVKYADPKTWADWREVDVCEIQLNEGMNEIVFTGTYVGTNFDWIELTTDGVALFCN